MPGGQRRHSDCGPWARRQLADRARESGGGGSGGGGGQGGEDGEDGDDESIKGSLFLSPDVATRRRRKKWPIMERSAAAAASRNKEAVVCDGCHEM